MHLFKQIDFWISAGLIGICAFATISSWSVVTLIYSYFIIGGWQVISMVVHFLNKWFMQKNGSRSFHHWLTLALMMIALIGWAVTTVLMILLLFLLVFSPILAIGYTAICYGELQELKLRHALNLK